MEREQKWSEIQSKYDADSEYMIVLKLLKNGSYKKQQNLQLKPIIISFRLEIKIYKEEE